MSTILPNKPAPRTVTMGDGRVVPCCDPLNTQRIEDQPRKLLIVIPYYEGDLQQAEALADLIADLERMRNDDADIMLFRRFDARAFSPSAVSKLQQKFGNVYQQQCRRRNATGYPFAANEMWYDLVTLMSQKEWITKYYAFLNMEPDCVPTRPGWIKEMADEYVRAYDQEGKLVVGHLHDHRGLAHINGAAMYATEIWRRAGGNVLTGGSPSKAYDTEKAGFIVPNAKDTPLIVLDFQRSSITREELYAAQKRGITPAIYHGVKDMSAILAVRQEWLNPSEKIKTKEQGTVFTYFVPIRDLGVDEQHKVLQIWRDAWESKGWFPVVLTPADARKHPRFVEIERRVASFPTINNPDYEKARWMRWLALEMVNGGLMTDFDVLPANFTPSDFVGIDIKPGTMHGLADRSLSAVFADRAALKLWQDLVLAYRVGQFNQQGQRPMFSDQTLMDYVYELQSGLHPNDEIFRPDQIGFIKIEDEPCLCLGGLGYSKASMIHFRDDCVKRWGGIVSKSTMMVAWLQNKLPVFGADAKAEEPEKEEVPAAPVEAAPESATQ